MFHNPTLDLYDQDQDRFFWYETGIVLRRTVSDHITAIDSEVRLSVTVFTAALDLLTTYRSCLRE